ncbi:MAG: amidase family protein [Thermoplasmatota archaeon]
MKGLRSRVGRSAAKGPSAISIAILATAALFAGCVAPTSSTGVTALSTFSAPSGGSTDCLGVFHGIDLENATIPQLERALASGNITSVELVQAYIARIHAYDQAGPAVNSVQIINPNALTEAAALDAERAAGHVRGPLHGIPILIKDNVGTNDEPTTAGSIALAKNVPPLNATLTDRLRAAGMIILGKTKLSEFANWVSLTMPNGYSSLGGQVHNAYTGGDPSGSSSGSGVAGSMAFAAITIGTETSGSILGPSDANSLVGVKPTTGLVSRAGVIPLAGHFDTPGPMGRDVTDVALVLGAIAGPDPKDPMTAASANELPANRDYTVGLRADALKGVRLGYVGNGTDPIFARAMIDLKNAGAILVHLPATAGQDNVGTPELGLIPNEFKFGINDYLAHEAGPGLPVKDLTGIIEYNQMHPDKVKYGQDLLIASDATAGSGPLADASATPVIQADRAYVDATFAQNNLAAMIGPSLQFVQEGAEAGYPTVIVPAGYNGLFPEGISFFGRAWSESHLLAYAYAYEQASHRREPPTIVNATLTQHVCSGGKPIAPLSYAVGNVTAAGNSTLLLSGNLDPAVGSGMRPFPPGSSPGIVAGSEPAAAGADARMISSVESALRVADPTTR